MRRLWWELISRPPTRLSKRYIVASKRSITVFLVVNTSLRWLNNVSGVHLVQVSLIFVGQQGFRSLIKYRSLLPIGWRTMQIISQRLKKMTNTMQRQTLLRQCKLALNAINTWNHRSPFKIWKPVAFLTRSSSLHFCQNFWNLLRERVLCLSGAFRQVSETYESTS